MTNAPKIDDLEAVRQISSILKEFNDDEKMRIIRWSLEKLGINSPIFDSSQSKEEQRIRNNKILSIKDFYQNAKPKGDNAFAVMTAYYYKFEAPESERKESIDGEMLQQATRLVGRERLKRPSDTLNNCLKRGYFNKTKDRGFFAINTVGENLIALSASDSAD